jgi:hypothetical protein
VTTGTGAGTFQRYSKLFEDGIPVGLFETIDCHEFACAPGTVN